MATHNGERFVREQIESILNQEFEAFELLVADDASVDKTREILREYAASDSRIRLIFRDTPLGYVKNFEALLNEASGDYIALSDQDDRWHRKKILRQMEAMHQAQKETPGAILVHSDLSLIDERGERLADSYFRKKGYRFRDEKSVAQMISRGGVMGNTVLINRPLLNRALPFPDKLVHHDYWLGVVAELFGRRVTISEPLVEYRVHSGNSSSRSRWWAGEYRYPWRHRWLPWRENNREEIMTHLLTCELSKEDRRLVEAFHGYLAAKKGWIFHYPTLARSGFFEGYGARIRMLLRLGIATILGEGTQ